MQNSLRCRALGIIFDVEDAYVRKHDRIKYVTLFHSNKIYQRIFDRFGYFMAFQYWNKVSYVVSNKYRK